jgi:F-type H+-transporting ATPase subunit delta
MSDIKIANRYASALFQQAIAENKLDVIVKDMNTISNTCRNSKDLLNILSNPIVKTSEKLNALKLIFASSNPIVLNFIELICSKNRENLILDIADSFSSLYRQHLGIERVMVTSAISLDETTQNSIKNFVKEKTGSKEIELHTQIQADIIGGMVIKFGDNLLDTSIAAQIRNLKKELNIA